MKHALDLEENTPGAVFFDGEYCQVEPLVNEESELVELFKQDNIAVAKLSAGTTGITQPLDAYKIFSAVHQLVNGQYLNGLHMVKNKSMCNNLTDVLDAHSPGPKGTIDTAKKRILLSGLTGVWEAICKYWQVDMGVKSFKEVGLHAEGGALICDPKRILKKFNIDEHHKGDKHRNMSAADSFEQECGQLVDAFTAQRSQRSSIRRKC